MANVFESIKDSLVGLFKGLYPGFDVLYEEAGKVEEDQQDEDGLEDYIVLDIIPAGNTTVSPYHTDRRVLVDVAIHSKAESNAEYLAMIGTVDAAIRPVFRFEDRAITVPDAEYRIVDKLLHCTFTLAFRDSADEPEPYPLMGELEATFKNQERA